MWRGVGVHTILCSEVEDDDEDEYCEQLFNAAVKLGDLIDDAEGEQSQSVRGHSQPGIYVHDTNAVTEAPATVIVYLALFLAHKDWDDTEALRKFVQHYDKHSMPNMYIVNETIKRNKKFQDE